MMSIQRVGCRGTMLMRSKVAVMSLPRCFSRRLVPLAALLSLSCVSASPAPEEVVRRYLSAPTKEEALALLAPHYVFRFGLAEARGIAKAEVSAMLNWDFSLRPTHDILAIENRGNTVIATVHEENDFSRLLGFPGWTATSTFIVDETGLIVSQLYVPREGQPDWRVYLEEPLQWIRANAPNSLERIHRDGNLVRSPDSAAEWVRLLRAWRKATGR